MVLQYEPSPEPLQISDKKFTPHSGLRRDLMAASIYEYILGWSISSTNLYQTLFYNDLYDSSV